MGLLNGVPVIGFCGYSGAGKSTILEKVIPLLMARGLVVGYLKHDAHGLQVDREGKDTDRMFRAGASVIAAASEREGFLRTLPGDRFVCPAAFAQCDIILVEGYKDAPWSKFWVHPHAGGCDEITVEGILYEVGGHSSLRHNETALIADQLVYWLVRTQLLKPLYGGVLIGGKSTRMGSAKALLKAGEGTMAEHVYRTLQAHCNRMYLLGAGPLPEPLRDAERIADVPGFEGPMAGLMAAHRFAPDADWIIAAVDLPNINAAYFSRFSRREPAFRFMGASSEKGIEPLAACYSSQLLARMAAEHRGERSIHRLLDRFGVKGDPGWYDAVTLKNVNHPGDMV